MREIPTAASDEQLVARIAASGCEEACAEIHRRFKRRIYLWCYRYAHDADDAVDLTQEVFIRLFRGIGSYSGRARFSTWVYRVTQNHCLQAIERKGDLWRRRLEPLEDQDVADERWAEDLARDFVAGKLEQILAEAGRILKPQELEAFILHYRDGLSVGEITAMLDCQNASGARTLIQNARRKLKRLTGRKGFGDE